MKKFRKCLVVVLALAVAMAFTACGSGGGSSSSDSSGKTYNLKLGTHYNTSHSNYKLLEKMVSEIKDETDGKVNIKIYPSSQLGDYSTMYGDLKSGALDMAMMSIASEYDKQFEMNFIPYAASNYKEAKAYLGPDSYFFSEYQKIHAKQKVHLFGIYAEGMIGFGFTKKPNNYQDPAVKKHLKVRAPAIEVYADVTKDLGYNSTTINYSDLYSAMQTGVCDGWIGGSPQLNYTDFKDVVKYYVPYNVFMENGGVFMSEKCYDKLPAKYQKVIDKYAKELVNKSFDQAEEKDKEYTQKLKDYGVKILPLTSAQLEACQKQVQKDVWPSLYKKFGKDRLMKIKDDIAKNAK